MRSSTWLNFGSNPKALIASMKPLCSISPHPLGSKIPNALLSSSFCFVVSSGLAPNFFWGSSNSTSVLFFSVSTFSFYEVIRNPNSLFWHFSVHKLFPFNELPVPKIMKSLKMIVPVLNINEIAFCLKSKWLNSYVVMNRIENELKHLLSQSFEQRCVCWNAFLSKCSYFTFTLKQKAENEQKHPQILDWEIELYKLGSLENVTCS